MSSMVRPRIVHVVDFSKRNSWIEELVLYLRQKHLDQGVLILSESGELQTFFETNAVKCVSNNSTNLLGFIEFVRLLKRWSQQSQVLLYAHGHLPSIFAFVANKLAKIDYVICHHQQPGYFVNLKKMKYLRASFHQLLAIKYYKSAKSIHSLSSEVTAFLGDHGITQESIHQIPLGIKFERFTKNARCKQLPSKMNVNFRILSVSRLVWEKRLDLAIRVVAELKKLGLTFSYEIVGAGPEASKLSLLIQDLGLERDVFLVGTCNDISSKMDEGDIFLHTSHTESYGQVLMEAKLSGLPIFSTFVGVTQDMAKLDDPQLHIFQSDNPHEMALDIAAYLDCRVDSKLHYVLDPKITYGNHALEEVLKSIEKMLRSHFLT